MPVLVYIRFDKNPLLFRSPKEVITCYNPAGLKNSFELMESMLDKGYFLAGYLSYEAGYSFENKLKLDKEYDFPMLQMGCYAPPAGARDFINKIPGRFRLADIHPSITYQDYSKAIQSIRDFIAAGDVYQITYCLKMKFGFEGSAQSLFTALLRGHPMPYPAYLQTGDYKILSLSPEMFMKKKGSLIKTKPMKGTWPRGSNFISDLRARFQLKYDEKNRAENLMITDLLRNDLGRIGRDVRVNRLFEVTQYDTLYQMTSSISAEICAKTPLYELFRALFPSGSVTGAPKIRAMEIIRGLENEERRIYTGAIGYITPERDIFFNVPIRTILLKGESGEMGVGGGIIWDSTSQGEWDESMLKSKFLFNIADKK
jgi:para-aminobenzoate synthetase/4-amino-4-deoxychorismate lyase